MRTHDLKTVQPFYDAIVSGEKTADVRRDDRCYRVGDLLWLREWHPERGYSGRFTVRQVTHLLFGWGVEPGYVALSLRPLAVFHERSTAASPGNCGVRGSRALPGHHAASGGNTAKLAHERDMPAATRRALLF